MRHPLLAAALLTLPLCLAAAPRHYELRSPDGRLTLGVDAAPQISYTLEREGVPVIAPSPLSVTLADGSAYDGAVRFEKALRRSVDLETYRPYLHRSIGAIMNSFHAA